MTPVRSSSLALVGSGGSQTAFDPDLSSAAQGGHERRAYLRLDPHELPDPLTARVKYGEPVTLVDVSAGGALVETASALRPDSTVVFEMVGGGAQQALSVVSRVLRCHVSHVGGGIRYRGACEFKRPLDQLSLIAPPPLVPTAPANFLKPEFALKTIVEGYRGRRHSGRMSGASRDRDALLDALASLRDAAGKRNDPIDRRLAQILAAIVPALQRNESPDDLMMEVLIQLREHVPALTIRVGGATQPPGQADKERITLNVWSEPAPRSAVTAEFPAGFDIDESQFRLLKAGAYLAGLAETWTPPPAEASSLPVHAPEPSVFETDAKEPEAPLPAGWQRVVVRFLDGKLLRGYTNTFHPDSAHLHLCPDVNCAPADRLFVPVARLKALFFVRDLAGNAQHVDTNVFDHSPRARKLEVTFRDGEVMTGSTLNYKPQGQASS